MTPLIYTDYDVRPDLLTADERSRFPSELTNEDRRAILAITRERIDKVDYDGYPMMKAEDWIQAYSRYIDGFDEQNKRPEFRDTIYRDVVLPQTGEVVPTHAGIAGIIQRLMDRGVVIDAANSRSAMMTDHPGMRWLHDPIGRVFHIDAAPGTHIYATHETERPRIVFPTDDRAKYRNDSLTIEAIRESAQAAGLIVAPYHNPSQPQQAIEVRLPYLMDGTDYDAFLDMADEHAHQQVIAGQVPDRPAWIAQFKASKQAIADAHGGYAMYADDMILDRFNRFERTLQRAMVSDRMVAARQQPTIHYDDFLTQRQRDHIQKAVDNSLQQYSLERSRPYAYQRYMESPERVDEIARMAGYGSYTDYLNQGRPVTAGDNRWSEFQKLAGQHLHTNQEGMLKLFRIENGIRNEVRRWRDNECNRLAAPVVCAYREAGYPVEALRDFFLVSRNDKKVEVVATLRGKTISKEVSPDTVSRLHLNACTPFEVALESFAKEIGWRGRLILPVSDDTLCYLQLDEKATNGQMPIRHDDRIYLVGEKTWDYAHALERFHRLPPVVQQHILDTPPPVRNIGQRAPEVAVQQIDATQRLIDESITDLRVIGHEDTRVGVRCKVNGQQMQTVLIPLSELSGHGLLPGEKASLPAKELMAASHADELFRSLDRKNNLRR